MFYLKDLVFNGLLIGVLCTLNNVEKEFELQFQEKFEFESFKK